mgnify:CR=1 FL=1
METLSADEIDDLLMRCGVGVLSLYDGTYPYAIPMSFGYDGDGPIFSIQLGTTEQSYKRKCLDRSENACFTVYDEPDAGIWHSAVLRGDLRELTDEEAKTAFAALAANAEFPADVRVWGVPIDEVNLELYGLDIEERSGRKFRMTE